MTTRFVNDKTTTLFKGPTGRSRSMILIYGNEVTSLGEESNGRVKVEYRQKEGWVRADELGDERPLLVYFIDVGQGDSAFIVTPAGKKILIDGGTGDEALQFLIWKYRLKQDPSPDVDIDLLVLTHADKDHIQVLINIIKHSHLHVKKIVHSGIARYDGQFNTELGQPITVGAERFLVTKHNTIGDLDLHSMDGHILDSVFQRWRDAIMEENVLSYNMVDSTTGTIDVGDPEVQLEVLGPRLVDPPNGDGSAYPWFSDVPHTINGHSVVLILKFGQVRMLFPGDVNIPGERHLMPDAEAAEKLDAHVIKVPHHGSHEYHLPFLQAVHPQASVISSGESPDHGHPRANLLGVLGKVSRSDEPLIFSTELSAVFVRAIAEDEGPAPDPTNANEVLAVHERFKKRLNGLINVRTDGRKIYAFRRVNTSYWWVSHEIDPAPSDP